MIKKLHIFFFILGFHYSFSQPFPSTEELRKSLNPYKEIVPHFFQHSFSLEATTTRDLTIVPIEEQFDYYNVAAGNWQPAFRFNYEYFPEATLHVMNEYNYQPTTQSWTNTRRVTHGYDALGFQASATEEVYDPADGGLMLQLLNTITHSINGNLLQEQLSYWNAIDESWLPDHKHNYTYHLNGKEESVIHENWSDSSLQWNPYQMYASSYNTNGQLILYWGSTWDPGMQQWENEIKDTISYNILQQLMQSETQIWSVAINDWIPYYRNNYEHDETGNLLKMTGYFWNENIAAFENSNQYLFNFNNTKLEEVIFQMWDEANGDWINFNRTAYSYDSAGYLTSKVISNWSNNSWTESYRYLYTNEVNGKVIQSIGQSRNSSTGIWEDIERYIASWATFTTGLAHQQIIDDISVFPNPSSDQVSISGLHPDKKYEITISDVTGIIYQSSEITGKQPIELNALSSGVYLLSIKENGRNLVAACKLVYMN